MPLKGELSHELLFGSQPMYLDCHKVISRDFQSPLSLVSITVRRKRYVAYTSKSGVDAMMKRKVL